MQDLRELELAKKLVNYSCSVKPNENVLVIYSDCSEYLINSLVKEVANAKGNIYLRPEVKSNMKNMIKYGTAEHFQQMADFDVPFFEKMDAVIMIRGSKNDFEFNDIPAEQKSLYDSIYYKPVHFGVRCKKKWVILRYPTPSFAQNSKMSTEDFEDFYFNVCNFDYLKLSNAMDNLKNLMDKTDKVQIIAPETDLTFSIKGMGAVKCCGECNIPDGELYTAPVKDSVNGTIKFNVPTMEDGKKFEYIKLTFENGKIIDFSSDNETALKHILNTDEGSRYVGEFAFGLNPYIEYPINDILFDEKMSKSIHIAVGGSLEDCDNGNDSAIHWDLIQSHKLIHGGGKIYFDDVLIYENGNFLLPELVALNTENLLKY